MLTRLLIGSRAQGSGSTSRTYRIEPWANITGHVPTPEQLYDFASRAGMEVVQAVQSPGAPWTLRTAGTPLFGQAEFLAGFRNQYLRKWDQIDGALQAPPWEPNWQPPQAAPQEPMCETMAGMVACASLAPSTVAPAPQPQPAPQPVAVIAPAPQPQPALQPAPPSTFGPVTVTAPAAPQPTPQPAPVAGGPMPPAAMTHVFRLSVVGGTLVRAWRWQNARPPMAAGYGAQAVNIPAVSAGWVEVYTFDGMTVALVPEVFDLRVVLLVWHNGAQQVQSVDVGNHETNQWQRVQGSGSGQQGSCGCGSGMARRFSLAPSAAKGSGCNCAHGSGKDSPGGQAPAGEAGRVVPEFRYYSQYAAPPMPPGTTPDQFLDYAQSQVPQCKMYFDRAQERAAHVEGAPLQAFVSALDDGLDAYDKCVFHLIEGVRRGADGKRAMDILLSVQPQLRRVPSLVVAAMKKAAEIGYELGFSSGFDAGWEARDKDTTDFMEWLKKFFAVGGVGVLLGFGALVALLVLTRR